MVENQNSALDATFAALADPTRRALLAQLAEGERSISELARQHPMSLPAVSKHLRVLGEAGLVVQRKEGRTRHCRLQPAPLAEAAVWLNDYRRFWAGSLDRLDDLTRTDPPNPQDKDDTDG